MVRVAGVENHLWTPTELNSIPAVGGWDPGSAVCSLADPELAGQPPGASILPSVKW